MGNLLDGKGLKGRKIVSCFHTALISKTQPELCSNMKPNRGIERDFKRPGKMLQEGNDVIECRFSFNFEIYFIGHLS